MSDKVLKNFFKNKNILITGASGSIGKAVLLELINYKCKVIRAMSNDENGLYDLSQELNISFNQNNFENSMQKKGVRLIHADIADKERCKSLCENIDYIIHAAAMKHVPLCEYNPFEANKINVIGTQNLVIAALSSKVSKFLFISTDKVVQPSSVLGSSKLLAEKIVINANSIKGFKKTIFSCVRFGNVIGSRGYILPQFIKQLKNKKNLTVTDKNMTRFFMTKQQAIKAITNSLYFMKGGETFVPKKLVSFKIVNLAKSLLELYGFTKSKIVFIGKRTGEKLHEKLIADYEIDMLSENREFYIINNLKKINIIRKNRNFTASNLVSQMSISQIKLYLKKIY